MGLVTPFDSDFWSTEESYKAPGLDKAHQRNLDNFGSATVTDRLDEHGLSYFSEVTGNSYTSPDEAVADEALFRTDPAAWTEAKSAKTVAINTATGTQTPIQNPNENPAATGALPNFFDITPPAPPAPTPAPRPIETRAGFTDELSAITSGRKTTVAPHPVIGSPAINVGGGAVNRDRLALTNPEAAAAASEPGAGAPVIHRDQIDRILGGLSGYQNDFYAMSQDNTGLSEAEAQLEKAHLLATQRARDELAANQAGALGAARGARNRGDRQILERQAIGEQAYLGSQAQRQQKNADDQLGLDLAILRAKEEDADRSFRFEALKAASDLGLNTAALEVDISKADLASANNLINNEFQAALQQGQLDEQQYEALLDYTSKNTSAMLGYARDMAAIQLEYDKLSVEDQNEADRLLMQKYGIDETTMVALKKIKTDSEFQWDDFLGKVVSGAIVGGTTIAGGVIAGPPGAAGGAAVGNAITS